MIVDWIIEIVDWALRLSLWSADWWLLRFFSFTLSIIQWQSLNLFQISHFRKSALKKLLFICICFQKLFHEVVRGTWLYFCREVPLLEPFKHPRQSKERGEIWDEIAMSLNSIISPKFISVRDRLALLLAKYKEKMIKKNKVLASNVMMKQK